MNLPKVSNYGIKRATGPIVVKGDVDNIFSDELMQLFRWAVCENGGISPRQVHIENTETLEIVDTFYQSWGCIGGYDERLAGYGQDNFDLTLRCQKKLNLVRGNLPLYHIKHRRRNHFYPFAAENSYIVDVGLRRK